MFTQSVVIMLLFSVLRPSDAGNDLEIRLEPGDLVKEFYRDGDHLTIIVNISSVVAITSISDFLTGPNNSVVTCNGSHLWGSPCTVVKNSTTMILDVLFLPKAANGEVITAEIQLQGGYPVINDPTVTLLLKQDIDNDSTPLCKNEDVFSFVTESGNVTNFWDQSHHDEGFDLPYVPNDTLAATWEVSGRTDPHFVITSNTTIIITNGSKHWGSIFFVTKNESYLSLSIDGLTQEAQSKYLFMVDGVPQDVEVYPWIIFSCTQGCSSAAVSVAGSSVLLLLGLLSLAV